MPIDRDNESERAERVDRVLEECRGKAETLRANAAKLKRRAHAAINQVKVSVEDAVRHERPRKKRA